MDGYGGESRGWMGETSSRARKPGWTRGPAYGCDEVESLRPDASLTMSTGALLASSSASRSWTYLTRIRAMRLKSPRRRCSCTLGCSGGSWQAAIPATILDGDWPPEYHRVGGPFGDGLQRLLVCAVIRGEGSWSRGIEGKSREVDGNDNT